MSEQAGTDVGMEAATQAYISTVLARKPDEMAILGNPPGVEDTVEIPIIDLDINVMPVADADEESLNP